MPGLGEVVPGLREGYTVPLKNLEGAGIITFGDVWFVNSGTGSDTANNGKSVKTAFATISKAVNSITANNGDVIYVLPGHTETITTTTNLALSVAGCNIIGLGIGSLRPTLTFTTANTANIPVTASNVSIQNILFVGNFLSIASVFTVTGTAVAKDFVISGCEFRDTSSVLGFLSIVTTNSTANTSDGLTFVKNKVFSASTSAGPAVVMLCTNSRTSINDNYIVHSGANNNVAVVMSSAALVSTQLEIARNQVFCNNTDTATGGVLLTTTSITDTGMVHDNYVKHLDVAAALMISSTGSLLGEFNNLATGDVDTSGFVLPAIGVN